MSTNKGELVIGKIPSYNSAIRGTTGIDYDNRLLNNLTVTAFEPIGYSLDLFGKSDSLYKMGKEIKSVAKSISDGTNPIIDMPGGTTIINTYTALRQWQQMQESLGIDVFDSFKIISTNDSTITESLSNGYKTNAVEDLLNTMSQNKLVNTLSTVGSKYIPSMDTTSALSLLNGLQDMAKNNFSGNFGQAASVLFGKAIGIQTAFPKIWDRSEYNNTSSLTIKLVSPSGHKDDVDNFVIKPLQRILLAASPITFDGISYGFPPLWKVEAKGLLNMKLAGITMVSISRGGPDTLFNRYNQPTNIDVRVVVEPVVQGFATPMSKNITDEINPVTGNTSMIVQSPNAITKPMLNQYIIKDTSIELKTLILTE